MIIKSLKAYNEELKNIEGDLTEIVGVTESFSIMNEIEENIEALVRSEETVN